MIAFFRHMETPFVTGCKTRILGTSLLCGRYCPGYQSRLPYNVHRRNAENLGARLWPNSRLRGHIVEAERAGAPTWPGQVDTHNDKGGPTNRLQDGHVSD